MTAKVGIAGKDHGMLKFYVFMRKCTRDIKFTNFMYGQTCLNSANCNPY